MPGAGGRPPLLPAEVAAEALQQAERAAEAAAVQPLVAQAAEAFGCDRVTAAHDFLEFPIPATD